jgi:hypothetical protein
MRDRHSNIGARNGAAGLAAVPRIVALLLVLVAALAGRPAAAEPRIALVVGNGAYQNVSPLENPTHDARLMAEALSGLGFRVTLLANATLGDLRAGFAQFGQELRNAGPDATGLFYYAGHGVQSFGSNYLLPVDARITDPADLDLVAIEAQSILRQMASARNKTNIVILDACRNNPFASIPELNDNGLAEMKAPTGTFLAYATEPGAVALDGAGGNSPFTQALVANIVKPGLPIEQMFKQVRVAVLEATGGLQTPWDTSSLTADFAFQAADKVDLGEQQLWDSVRGTRDPVQIMLFMRAYPDGTYVEDARKLLAEVMAAEIGGPVQPEPEPQPEGPGADEQQAFAAAQAEASTRGWETFLTEHPDSAFREAAEAELAALREKTQTDPINEPQIDPTPTPEPETQTAGDGADLGELAFATPIGAGPLAGRSIEEIIAGSPDFPPIEGLPDEVWKGKHCADCHQWTQKALCDQGTFYVTSGTELPEGEVHPLNGFRQVLKAWAAQGCR